MESIKAWRIMREGARSTIKAHFPDLPNSEVERLLRDVEKECEGLSAEDMAGCVYRKIEEIRRGKA